MSQANPAKIAPTAAAASKIASERAQLPPTTNVTQCQLHQHTSNEAEVERHET